MLLLLLLLLEIIVGVAVKNLTDEMQKVFLASSASVHCRFLLMTSVA